MSFTINGQTLALTLSITIPDDLDVIRSQPDSGQFKITDIRMAADDKNIVITQSSVAST